ncbi:MAG TPA: MarP family serine protease [Actinomycetota bacterium]|nr:MarP family serine protease [Actinomycetota bacterium]
MNVLDVVILLLLGLSVVTGFRRGAALQLMTYAGLIAGLVAGALLAPRVARLAGDVFGQAAAALFTLLALAAAGDAVGFLIGRRVWAAARRSRLDPIDSGAGSVVGMVAALVTVWFLAFNLVQGPFPVLSRQIRESAIVRGIDAVLPRPPSLLAQVRTFLDRFGFPEVFAGLPPAPAGPVEAPTRAEAARAFDAADQSTVRIVGPACGRISQGSGFVAAGGVVITNAHVVAGVARPTVQLQDGGSFSATTVLFDPGLDLAVLRPSENVAAPLDLDPIELERGAEGAVLGFPGGDDLSGEPAAVLQTIAAVGRDIYGRDVVRRDVYELQTDVHPGNSGGPFVTTGGDVAGVVFAAATADEGIGYALTAAEVEPRIDDAQARSSPVGTGPCLD